MRLTPPTKNVFFFSVLLAVLALIVYVLGLFGIFGGVPLALHIAFWLAGLAWIAVAAGVALKGV